MANYTIRMNYSVKSDRIAPRSLAAARSVCLAQVLDLRKQGPCHVMKKISLSGGPATGNYLSDQPVADILYKAVTQALELAGIAKSSGEMDLSLSLEIEALDFSVMVGFAQCVLKGNIQVKVAVTEASSGKIVWEGLCEGTGRTGNGQLVHVAFTAALDDFILNLLACPGFQ